VFDLSQLDFGLFVSTMVFFAMGLASLVFSLSLYSKSRAIQKLPRNLPVKVFNKTFSVFNPYPEHAKMIHEGLEFLSIIIVFAAIATSIVALVAIVDIGLILGVILFAVCAVLMTPEVCFDINQNAGLYLRAIQKGLDLGVGDLKVLSILKKTLPRLTIYYLSLAIVFFAFALMSPYVLPAIITVSVGFLGALVGMTASQGILSLFYPVLLFAVVVFVIEVAVGVVNRKILGLPLSWSTISLDKPFEAMKQWVRWHHHELLYRPPPEPDEPEDSEREKS
jgi:hypothetical protein